MKTTVILCFVALNAFVGCQKNMVSNTFNLNDTLQIAKNEMKYNYDNSLSIRFDSVVSDSRCPINVNCIWSGGAVVKFTFTNKRSKTSFNLNTLGINQFRSDSLIQGYRIKLIYLSPNYTTSDLRSKKELTAKIFIKKE